jgi:hypothetical protein
MGHPRASRLRPWSESLRHVRFVKRCLSRTEGESISATGALRQAVFIILREVVVKQSVKSHSPILHDDLSNLAP